MASHEQKQCPRCHSTFECKSGSIELCQCNQVLLTDAHRDYIHSLYDACLCASCLAALRSIDNVASLVNQPGERQGK
ncbi:MAG: cysteine-rich CWC family protein [Gammaproteobacteria bacterium]|nr:cysteine-rich CWC family protein [Gammaproteobacteria bacterium]